MSATMEKSKEAEVKATAAERTRDLPERSPAADIWETTEAITVVVDMPGVGEKDVDVRLEEDVLTLRGVSGIVTPADHRPLYRGFAACEFVRSFVLNADVDRDGIKATIRSGVLSVRLPKTEKAKPRTIPVEAT